jgi:hypothetical protein
MPCGPGIGVTPSRFLQTHSGVQLGQGCFGHVPVVGDDLQGRGVGFVDEVLDEVVGVKRADRLCRGPPRVVVARLHVPGERSRPECREGGPGVRELRRIAVEREPEAGMPLHPGWPRTTLADRSAACDPFASTAGPFAIVSLQGELYKRRPSVKVREAPTSASPCPSAATRPLAGTAEHQRGHGYVPIPASEADAHGYHCSSLSSISSVLVAAAWRSAVAGSGTATTRPAVCRRPCASGDESVSRYQLSTKGNSVRRLVYRRRRGVWVDDLA